MNFEIESNGKVIAAFLNESDRNLCLERLAEIYDDVEFKPKNKTISTHFHPKMEKGVKLNA